MVDAQATLFFDSAGNPDYALVNVQVRDFIYNSKTGEGFADTSTYHEELDVVVPLSTHGNLVISVAGLSYHLTVPGEGVVLIEAGRLEWNEADELVFVAGQHQVLVGDTEKLCEALA